MAKKLTPGVGSTSSNSDHREPEDRTVPQAEPSAATPPQQTATSGKTVEQAFLAMSHVLEQVQEHVEVMLKFKVGEEGGKPKFVKFRLRSPYVDVTDESFTLMYNKSTIFMDIQISSDVTISYSLDSGKVEEVEGVCMAGQLSFPGTPWALLSFVLLDKSAP